MPKPDVKVLLALAEAYLDERKSTWGIEVLNNGKLKLPTNDKWVEDKIDALNRVLKQIVKTEENNIEQWIALAFHIHAEELTEAAKLGFTTINHLLLDLFRAMRSYIVNSIKEEADFTKKFADLKHNQKTHEDTILRLDKFTLNHDPNERVQANMELDNTNKQLDSLCVESNYLAQYVNRVIVTSNKFKELKVTDYKLLIDAAKNGLTSAEYCMKLMDTKNIVMMPANTNTVSATKTAAAPEPVAPAVVKVTSTAEKPPTKSSTKQTEGASALIKNSVLAAPAAPKAPRKGKGKAKPQPIPLAQFNSESESPDRDDANDFTPVPNANRSTRSGRNY